MKKFKALFLILILFSVAIYSQDSEKMPNKVKYEINASEGVAMDFANVQAFLKKNPFTNIIESNSDDRIIIATFFTPTVMPYGCRLTFTFSDEKINITAREFFKGTGEYPLQESDIKAYKKIKIELEKWLLTVEKAL